jgi:hypothetical protein
MLINGSKASFLGQRRDAVLNNAREYMEMFQMLALKASGGMLS